jgi:hypothetical protein
MILANLPDIFNPIPGKLSAQEILNNKNSKALLEVTKYVRANDKPVAMG